MGHLKRIRRQLERHAPAPAPDQLEVVVRHTAIAPDGTRGDCWIRIGKGPRRRVEDLSDQELRGIIGGDQERLEHLTPDQLIRLARGEPHEDVAAGPTSTWPRIEP